MLEWIEEKNIILKTRVSLKFDKKNFQIMIHAMKLIFDKKNLISILSILISAIWILFTFFTNSQEEQTIFSAPQKGFVAPDFTLNDLEGNQYQLSAFKGNYIMLNVWASWCKPCQYEMPAMQRLYEKYKDDGFVILAVNNTISDNYQDVVNFVVENNLTFPILLDTKGDISKKYQVQALPSTYFIDKNGKIADIIIGGPMSEALIEAKIQELSE